jgi:hypothetical protein
MNRGAGERPRPRQPGPSRCQDGTAGSRRPCTAKILL